MLLFCLYLFFKLKSTKMKNFKLTILYFILLTACKEDDNSIAKIIIKPPENYIEISKLEGKIEPTSGDANCYQCNLIFETTEDTKVENEIRHWLYKIWLEHKDLKAINVKCFLKSESFAFKNGIFAPYGDWAVPDPKAKLYDYKVIIN